MAVAGGRRGACLLGDGLRERKGNTVTQARSLGGKFPGQDTGGGPVLGRPVS